MTKIVKTTVTILLIFGIILAYTPVSKAYTAPVSTVRIGLYYGSIALPSANLQNVTGTAADMSSGISATGNLYRSALVLTL
jgi:hypothetical protein